jgi:hypothetical protein
MFQWCDQLTAMHTIAFTRYLQSLDKNVIKNNIQLSGL